MYNIIVIDDHKMLREMISETLNTRGFNVIASSGNAKDSVSLCEKFKPDLILMDICTENNSSGLAYSKIIKENFPSVKIILMTGVPDLTLESHISSIYEKTGYNNLAKLAIYCVGNGLIVPNLETPNE